MSNQIVVFASFFPREGCETAVEQVLREVLGPTRAEPGCLRFDFYRADADGATLHLFETFADDDALQAHRDSHHYRTYRAAITGLLERPPNPLFLKVLDVAGQRVA